LYLGKRKPAGPTTAMQCLEPPKEKKR